MTIPKNLEREYITSKLEIALQASYFIFLFEIVFNLVYALLFTIRWNPDFVVLYWVTLGLWIVFGFVILICKKKLVFAHVLGPMVLLIQLISAVVDIKDFRDAGRVISYREFFLVSYMVYIIFMSTKWIVHTIIGIIIDTTFIMLYTGSSAKYLDVSYTSGFTSLFVILFTQNYYEILCRKGFVTLKNN